MGGGPLTGNRAVCKKIPRRSPGGGYPNREASVSVPGKRNFPEEMILHSQALLPWLPYRFAVDQKAD
jgi:hypothetical protein